MKGAPRGIIFLALVAVVACVACWFTSAYLNRPHHAGQDHGDAHAWIHTQLGITPEQEKALEPIEQRYAEQKKHYAELLRIANNELGKAILEDRSDSERVKAVVARIHQLQGELQNATLQHIFEMQPVLTPQQYEKLLRMTSDALTTGEHGR
jgi:Spy/CpxP family protein refolding chaperone